MLPALHLSPTNVTEIYMYLYKLITTTLAQAVILLRRYHMLCSTSEDANSQLSKKAKQTQTPSWSLLKPR